MCVYLVYLRTKNIKCNTCIYPSFITIFFYINLLYTYYNGVKEHFNRHFIPTKATDSRGMINVAFNTFCNTIVFLMSDHVAMSNEYLVFYSTGYGCVVVFKDEPYV